MGLEKKIAYGGLEKRCFKIFFERHPTIFFDVARHKSRVALRTTNLAAAVAQNGHFDPNVAPAQQRNS